MTFSCGQLVGTCTGNQSATQILAVQQCQAFSAEHSGKRPTRLTPRLKSGQLSGAVRPISDAPEAARLPSSHGSSVGTKAVGRVTRPSAQRSVEQASNSGAIPSATGSPAAGTGLVPRGVVASVTALPTTLAFSPEA